MMRRFRALLTVVALVPLLVAGPVAAAAGSPGQGSDPVRIVRDEYGVPHLFAGSTRALFFGVGYVQGQDRLWQADIHRRLATGTLSDLFGPSELAGDVLSRQLFGSAARRAQLLAGASPLTRTVLEAFTDGMNAWIGQAAAAGQLPGPYALFGPPRPWTVDDSIATYLFFGTGFGTSGGEELDNLAQLQDLIARLGPAAAQQVFAEIGRASCRERV